MIDQDTRDRILASPEALLEDRDVMQALIGAGDRAVGGNVVDLRGLAMERLEERLERLEDTHRFVLAAAYENLSGTQMIQRAVLRLMEPADFAEFGKFGVQVHRFDQAHVKKRVAAIAATLLATDLRGIIVADFFKDGIDLGDKRFIFREKLR